MNHYQFKHGRVAMERSKTLRCSLFTLIERVPMRRMFLIDRKESIPPIVQFGRIA